MVIKIVIGANFGDEGKGLMTDYFCHQAELQGKKCLVVCCNGGAQRGHTVVRPDGKRHIFHHFGSGVYDFADTYLASEFILNPLVFAEEISNDDFIISTNTYINPDCMMSTPFDMIANQIIEESRGKNKHGSCGMGIWETIRRYEHGYPDEVVDDDMTGIDTMWDDYYVDRLNEKGIEISDDWNLIVRDPGLVEHTFCDMDLMYDHTNFANDSIIKSYDYVVFEMAQGLLLDQNNLEYSPNLTPSNTGLKNPLKHITDLGLENEDIEVCYVSRTYLTRHGAGRFDSECSKDDINPEMYDKTNVPNPSQGTIRYGILYSLELIDRIEKDFSQCEEFNKNGNFKKSIAITHLNENSEWLDTYNGYIFNNMTETFDNCYVSNGESFDYVHLY